MTSLQAAAYFTQVLAAVFAVLLAQRRREHVPAAVALVALATANALDGAVAAVLTPYPVEPWEGWRRVLVYVDGALNLTNYTTLAGLPVVLAVAPEQRRRAAVGVAAVWLFASIVLAALYPSPVVRGAGLRQVYVAVDFVALAVAALALIIEARGDIVARRLPSSASAVATALVILDGGLLVAPFSPWRGDVFAEPYFGPQLVIAILFFLIAATEAIVWQSTSRHG